MSGYHKNEVVGRGIVFPGKVLVFIDAGATAKKGFWPWLSGFSLVA